MSIVLLQAITQNVKVHNLFESY